LPEKETLLAFCLASTKKETRIIIAFMKIKSNFFIKNHALKLLLALFLGVSSFQHLMPVQDLATAKKRLTTAISLFENGKYDLAIPIFKEVIPAFEEAKDWVNWKKACIHLDGCFYDLDDGRTDGILFFNQTLKRVDGLENEMELKSLLLLILGDNYMLVGDHEFAVSAYEKGLILAEKLNKPDQLKGYYGNLGRIYWENGNHARALEYQLKSLQIARRGKDQNTIATLLSIIGDSYKSQGDSTCFQYFRESIAINPNDPQTWIQFSKAYQDFGKKDSAIIVLNQVLTLLQGDAEKADAYYQFARIYKDVPDLKKANIYIEKALYHGLEGYGESDIQYARINNLAGQIYLASNNPDKALTWFHKNLLLQSEGVSKGLDLTQNPTLDQLSPGSYWVLGSLDGKGEAFHQKYLKTKDKKNLEHAIAAFDLALSYGEQMRLSYGHESSKTDLYEYLNPAVEGGIKATMTMAALEPGNAGWQEKAFEFVERVKAAIMAEAMHNKDIKRLAGIEDSVLEQEHNLQERIAALEIQLQSEPDSAYQDTLLETRLMLTKFESELEKNYPRYRDLKYGFQKTVDIAKIRQHLAENALLVEYFKGDSTLYTFALSKTAFKAYATPITADFDTTLAQYRRSVSDWGYIQDSGKLAEQDFLSAAPKLYEWLLAKPLSEFQAKSLVIVPDGALGLISFDALLTAPYQSDWTDLGMPYLIKKYPISYDWSAGAMVSQNREAPEVDYHFGGFGTQYDDDPKPIAMRSDLGPLPNADDEVRDIDSLLNGKSWLNAAATKDRFLNDAPRCGILHIATHGILDEENPMQSHLVFNKTSDGADNRLFASELYTLDLHAQMAVLSACNTGSGKIAAGEGNMSIARAFAYAGCPTLVSNLWSANDLASAKLMTLFYKHLKAGVPVDEALRAAKLSYLETGPGAVSLPYYWASFIVVGEPAALFPPPFNWWWLAGGLLIGTGLLYFLYRRFRK